MADLEHGEAAPYVTFGPVRFTLDTPAVEPHPIRLVVTDDLARSRLTVFFRLLLALPHLVWLSGWGYLAELAALGQWFVTLITGRPQTSLNQFLSAYLRYNVHVYAYLLLAGSPFPGFMGQAGSYPVDVEIAPPERQNRWKTGFRLILAIPAALVHTVLIYLALVISFLAWFACLALGRMPQGFRDAEAYALNYLAQTYGYVLLITDRYPTSDPFQPMGQLRPGPQPVRIVVTDDGRRARAPVFFRWLLVLPHFVWLFLWGVVAAVAAVVNWIATLVMGRSPLALHRFLSAYLRYRTHVYAFLYLVGNPFPGFVGAPLSYPIDIEIDPPASQHRLKTLFRPLLAIPAFIVSYILGYLLYVIAFLGWFAALVTGRMPLGLRNTGAYALRYEAQLLAYSFFFITDRYPYTGPAEFAEEAPPEPAPEPEPAPSLAE
jgi:hypothetical protein